MDKLSSPTTDNLGFALPEGYEKMTDQELAVWYNDTVIYSDKVRLNRRQTECNSSSLELPRCEEGKPKVNCYFYRHYSFIKDIEMIFATVLGKKIQYAGEEI